MRIGVPKEIKVHEYRVGLVPSAVRELRAAGHELLVQTGAGNGIGCSDEDYRQAGAAIAPHAEAVWDDSQLIVKVKEPQLPECVRLRRGQMLFTYLHLAADAAQADALRRSGCVAIGYETVTAPDGSLPLLTPMSEVAGRMSIQVGAAYLQAPLGGSGILLGGVAGVAPAHVVVIGAGVAGSNAIEMAHGLRAQVSAIDRSIPRLRQLDAQFHGTVRTLYSTVATIERAVREADLVIGAVLLPGAATPKLVSAAMIRQMRPGSVVVDIAIDQGGCFETSRPTTHAAPTFSVDGVTHYCVTNMPGAVPRTSAYALNHATLPYVHALAQLGWERATRADQGLAAGLNVVHGDIVHPAVAQALGLASVGGGAQRGRGGQQDSGPGPHVHSTTGVRISSSSAAGSGPA
ncbi:MAG: alanine dehydrogenase [Steroidobacteraceae bacterium]